MSAELLDALYKAHAEVALRANPSLTALTLTASGSASYFNAIASALLTLGGLHGPLTATFDLLASEDPLGEVDARLAAGYRIPGWGNSFHKGEVEPAFRPVAKLLQEVCPELGEKIDLITKHIHGRGLNIYPNPSTYTAATAIVVGLPREAVGMLVIQARIIPWTSEFVRINRETPPV